MITKKCLYCRKLFSGRPNKKFCSWRCRNSFNNNNQKALNPRASTNSSTTGAIAELVVACDLLRKGYEVFRALSPSCSCDLAILKNKKIIPVEVRTGYVTKQGKLHWPRPEQKIAQWAIVFNAGTEIRYEPKL